MADQNPNAMGLDMGGGGAAAYQLFKDMLAQRFADAQFAFQQKEAADKGDEEKQALAEKAREADQDNSRIRDIAVANEQGVNSRFQTEQGRLSSEFDANAPIRIAQAAEIASNTARNNYDISPQAVADKLKVAQGEAAAQGAQARQTEGMRETYETTRPVIMQSTDGTGARAMQYNPDTQQYEAVATPAGMAPKGAPTPTLKGADSVAASEYDNVIREATRLQGLLKQSGLDKDNSMISAYTRDALAKKLKISSNDPALDVITQNLGYLQTQALRGAAQGQRLTQPLIDIFAPHIASPSMSGARIAETLPEMLRQVTSSRKQLYTNARVADPGVINADGSFVDGFAPANSGGSSSNAGSFNFVPGKGLVPR